MKYAIISGSSRENSQSLKVSKYIKCQLRTLVATSEINLIDLTNYSLPHWDEELWKKAETWSEKWYQVSQKLKNVNGIVIITPEWGGMVPPVLKNFFQLCSQNELAHKPGLIISISSNQGGSYPISELRISSYKNTKICYLPDHIIIRNVNSVLNNVYNPENDNDFYIRERIRNTLLIFENYAKAFKEIRNHLLSLTDKYPYGM